MHKRDGTRRGIFGSSPTFGTLGFDLIKINLVEIILIQINEHN
jgi:hypothetical protein